MAKKTEENTKRVKLTIPQVNFVYDQSQFPAMVAGYGSGKTTAAVNRTIYKLLQNADSKYGGKCAYYLPTYNLIQDIAYPAFTEALDGFGYPYSINKADKVITVQGLGVIILRTMDNPERIVGYEVHDSIADELDTLPFTKAADVWSKIVSRNRLKKPDGMPNSVGVVTTPEGFRFVYDKWVKNPMQGSRIIRASTYSNYDNLPPEYIDTLKESFPEQQLAAYLDGQFVNMSSGSVYVDFDRRIAATSETIKDDDVLHIGMDFNVGNMNAAVSVLRDDQPHFVDEITGVLDTPGIIQTIKARYQGHRIFVYPDASGKSRKTVNASESDIALLRGAGFTVLAHSQNPFVRDRVAAVNKKFRDKECFVNPDRCPELVEGLERQAFNKAGEPDKSTGLDHLNDAIGYMVVYRYPIRHGSARTFKIKGL